MRTMHKKMVAMTICIAALATNAVTQTNTFPASGNAGIGSTTPQTSLQIGGFGPYLFPGGGGTATGYASSALGFNLYRGSDNNWHTTSDGANGGGLAFFGDTAGDLFLADVPSAGNVNQVLADSSIFPGKIALTVASGNVGIGTTAPNSSFDLTASGNGLFTSNSTNNSGVYITGQLGPYGVLQAVNAANSTGIILALQPYGGNIGIGTTTPGQKLEVNGYIQTDAGVYFPGNSTPQTTPWTGVLCGGDYAESVEVTGGKAQYEPGDVMVVDPEAPGSFLKSREPYSTLVAGIYSTKPGVVGKRSRDPDKLQNEIPMAMVGIVPTKVSAENGAVKPGDLLVTSSTPGYAMKGADRERMTGAVVGKALGSVQNGTGVVEVLVTLQ